MSELHARLDRRRWMLGAGAGLAAGLTSAGAQADQAVTPAPGNASGEAPAVGDAAALIAPLTVGSRIGHCVLEAIQPLDAGAVVLVLSGEPGVRFQLDVCARDGSPGAAQPPARSDLYEVFLSNGGEGSTDSVEPHGLAAMAIAEVLRKNERNVSRDGFMTLRERLAVAADAVRRST